MSGILVPVGVGLRGDVKMIMRNVVTGEIETREMRNTLFGSYLNSLFSSTRVFAGGILWCTGSTCFLGTSDVAASRSDTGIKGTTLASKAGNTSFSGTHPKVKTITTVFPTGVGTGLIKEVVLQNTARQVVSPALDKTANHELTVTWTITLSRGADSWSGTIPAGQRDGATDINWVATINNNQLGGCANCNVEWGYLYLALMGTSNAPSDLINDPIRGLKGTVVINEWAKFKNVLPYTTNSFYRDVQLGLDVDQGNGSIGETIVSSNTEGFARITFDPPLDKIDTYRLYLTFRLAVVNAS